MDPIILLQLDAVILVIATVILSYYFFKDMIKEFKEKK